MADIKVGIIVDDKGATKTLADFDKQVKKVGEDASKINPPLKSASKTIDGVAKSSKTATTQLKGVGDAMKGTNTHVNSAKASFGTLAGSIGKVSPMAGKLTTGFGELGVALRGALANPYVAAGVATLVVVLGQLGAGLMITSKVSALMDTLKDTADAIGISVQEYQAMNAMLIANGSSMDKFSGAFATFQDKVGSADKVFKQYGITLVDNDGYLKDSLVVQDEFLLKVSKMRTETEKLTALRDAYGKKGSSLMGSVVSEQDYINAKKMAEAMVIPESTVLSYTKIGDAMDIIKGMSLVKTSGIFKPVAESFTSLIETLKQSGYIKTVFEWILKTISTTTTNAVRDLNVLGARLNLFFATSERMSIKYNPIKLISDADTKAMGEIVDYIEQSQSQLKKLRNEISSIDAYSRSGKGSKGVAKKNILGESLSLFTEQELIEYKHKAISQAQRIENEILAATPYGGLEKFKQKLSDYKKIKNNTDLTDARKREVEAKAMLAIAEAEKIKPIVFGSNIPDAPKSPPRVRPTKTDKVEEKKEENAKKLAEEIDYISKNKLILQGFEDFRFANRSKSNEVIYTIDQIEYERKKEIANAELKIEEMYNLSVEDKQALHNQTMFDINRVYDQKELDAIDEFALKEDEKRKTAREKNKAEIIERSNMYIELGSAIGNAITAIMDMNSAKRMKDLENEKTTRLDNLNNFAMTGRRRNQMEADINSKYLAEEKKVKEKEKKWAIAQAMINMASGISMVWAQAGANWVIGAIGSGIQTANGIAQIAAINSQNFKNSGVVGGFEGSSVGMDNVTVGARKGEMFLNSTDQRTLFNGIKSGNLGGSGGLVQITQGNIIVQGGANQSAIDQIKAETQRFSSIVKETVLDLQYRHQLSFA